MHLSVGLFLSLAFLSGLVLTLLSFANSDSRLRKPSASLFSPAVLVPASLYTMLRLAPPSLPTLVLFHCLSHLVPFLRALFRRLLSSHFPFSRITSPFSLWSLSRTP
ncbi:hypothetical protein BJV74DRAFT_818784 [Russula compacta]|nr:hypothetical protein BJV74DRAFT_818784 [Russula compacta]